MACLCYDINFHLVIFNNVKLLMNVAQDVKMHACNVHDLLHQDLKWVSNAQLRLTPELRLDHPRMVLRYPTLSQLVNKNAQ